MRERIPKVKVNYRCMYCGHKFTRMIGKYVGHVDPGRTKIRAVSSQVRCDRCGNFSKAWE